MQVRHEPRLVRERGDQLGIRLDGIDRGQAQPGQLGHMLEDLADETAEPRSAGEVAAVARQIDPGEHHLSITALGEPTHLRHHLAHGYRPRIAAPEWDDAEGAAMIAAV